MKQLKPWYLISLLAGGVILLVAFGFTGQFNPFAALSPGSSTKDPQPLFSSLDQFVLAAQNKILLENNTQVSSGDLAANQEIRIRQNNIINGSLFSNEVRIGATSTINGNASFNKLEIAPNSQILGTTSSPISLPIIKLPVISDFPTGNQRLLINQSSTISPGAFDEIEVQENTQLTLNPGVYNLNKLRLRNNSKLLFSGKTTINIKNDLEIGNRVLIAQTGNNILSTDLQINVQQDQNINIGKDSLLGLKLLAPNSQINLGEQTTFRGQILAKEIKVGEDAIISIDVVSYLLARQEDFVSIEEGERFVVNQIILQLVPEGTFADAIIIVNSINGRIVGVVPSINLYQVKVITATIQELENLIQQLRFQQNPKIKRILRNTLINLIE